NRAFDQIPRERFLVVKILEVGAGEQDRRAAQRPEFTPEMMAAGEMPPDYEGPRPAGEEDQEGEAEEEEKPLTVEVQFEKKGETKPNDASYLLGMFDQKGIDAQLRGVRPADAADRGVAVDPKSEVEEEYYIFTLWLTFGEKPATGDEAADAPSAPE
ncbi:MAG: hypothetical protein ACOC8D_00950, partial [bacterium]